MRPSHESLFPFVSIGNAKGKRGSEGGVAVTIETDRGEFAASPYSVHDLAELEAVVAAIQADHGTAHLFVRPAILAVLLKADTT